jgi:hypothetical protein
VNSGGVTKLQKTIARFEPVAALGEAACERHYRRVHLPLARRPLGSVETIRRYSTWHVRAQYDAAGGWNLAPRAWRFATQLFHDPAASTGEAATAFPANVRNTLAEDHRNCLSRLRRFDVEDRTLRDLFGDQRTGQGYVFEYERSDGDDPVSARLAFGELASAAVDRLEGAPGLRRVVSNTVRAEAESEALDEPGQRLTGKLMPSTLMVGYLEVTFDHSSYGRAVFATEGVRQVLQSREFADSNGYEIVEEVGFDKR